MTEKDFCDHSCKGIIDAEERIIAADIDDQYDLAELFKVFGDSTRVRILSLLMGGEVCVLHISEALEMNQSAVSHQLRILRQAGLVRPRRDGKTVYYALDDEHVRGIMAIGLAHVLHRKGETDDEEEQ